MGNMVEIKVPDIGDFKEVEVIEVLVKPGDVVNKEQSLITVESDKASMEIPSSASGTVREMKVKLGDKVSEGSPVVLLESGAVAANQAAPPAAAAPPPPAAPPPSAPPPQPARPAPTSPAPQPEQAAAPLVVKVPDIGDFKDVEVIEVLVKPGDKVAKEQSLITVESDKASMEIPSPAEGVVESAIGIVARHDKVFVRVIILFIGLSDDDQLAISLDRHRVGDVGATINIGHQRAADTECRIEISSRSLRHLRTNEPSQRYRRGSDSRAKNQTIVKF